MVKKLNKRGKYLFVFSSLLLYIYIYCLESTKYSSNLKVLDLAHRGYALKNEESTIKAFKYAINQNTDGLEFDIRQTKDNIIIVTHNHKINIFNKKVEELDYNKIKKHTNIPTFKEVVQLAKKHDKMIWVEIKDSVLYNKIIDNMLIILTEENYINNVIVQSFKLSDLKYIYQKNKNIKLFKLEIFGYSYDSIPRYIDYIGLPIIAGVINCNIIKKIHKLGYKVIFWRENSLFENKYFINFLIKKQADGFMLDKPLKFFVNKEEQGV